MDYLWLVDCSPPQDEIEPFNWAEMQSRETLFGEFGSAKSFGETSQLLPYGVPLTAGSLLVLAGYLFDWWVI